jgi:hypothetical protein
VFLATPNILAISEIDIFSARRSRRISAQPPRSTPTPPWLDRQPGSSGSWSAFENRIEVDQMTDARAYVMGRNMFGPVRGEWDRRWNGWWSDDPPFHAPVFVLTHHPREPQPMEGGTTYHFVTDGVESALAQAREAAGEATSRSMAARAPSTSISLPA